MPSTIIIFITQDDFLGKNLAMYTFREWCEEVPDLPLEDGTCKIFLNMTSKIGRPELISLLQYMKRTTLDNENIVVKDERILDLDRIVEEVKQSEEWEVVEMGILEIGQERGSLQTLVRNVDSAMKNFKIDLKRACEGLDISVEAYEAAREQIAMWGEEETNAEIDERNMD